ncbi:MAG: polysaccharide biosynthesis tyrosine autokinase [Chloroflexi bacterium]|jgi:capsular exopolysaccharide synthesis family protein|nr:polysaccharide biosynthesis tyrosine autokinase [Chloroflexota bacterium]
MELRLLITLFRRWFWLLLMGAVLGGGAYYLYSIRQPSMYEASTKVMVIQPRESLSSDLTNLTDRELAETYRNLLVVQPVLEATSARVGFRVSGGQISSKLIEGTLFMIITVRDRDPERAALIANSLVDSLIEQNDALQADRYEASEESLKVQIMEVEEQLAALRAAEGQVTQLSEADLVERKQELESSILELNGQVVELEEEIAGLMTLSVAPLDLTSEQRQLLDEKVAQLELLQLGSAAARERYQELLSLDTYEGEQGDQEAQVLEIANQISALEGEIAELAAIETEGQLTDEQRTLLAEKRAQLALLTLTADVSGTRYQAVLSSGTREEKLQAQEEMILTFAGQIDALEAEIEDITSEAETEPDQAALEQQALIRDKRAELALVQLNLDMANDSYRALFSPADSAGTDGNQNSQDGTNQALYQQIYSSLRSNFEAVRLARIQSTPNIVQVEKAAAGIEVGINAISNAMLGASVGLIVMGSIAFLVEYLDDTLKTPGDIDKILGLPVIGYVAQSSELSRDEKENGGPAGPFVSNNPRSPLGEAFRSLRTNLEFADVDRSLKTILVSSPGPGEGKTTIAANLAAAFAQQQKRVFLLDCDLRKPSIHKVFGLPNHRGLSNVFLGQVELQDAVHIYDPSLALVTSGTLPSNPAELLGSEKMTQFLNTVNEMSDVVVIDSPPSIVSDAAVLSPKVDGVVMVIHPSRTRADEALAQLEQLKRTGARVVGVVLNRIPRKRAGYYGRYRYKYRFSRHDDYYGYAYNESSDGQGQRRSKGLFGRLARPFRKRSSSKKVGGQTIVPSEEA